jgi:hypothetical protein
MTPTLNDELALIPERVARGAAKLDEVNPGWRASIDGANLRMGGCASCVLGQLYGNYVDGLDAFFKVIGVSGRNTVLDSQADVHHGFDAPKFRNESSAWDIHAYYEALATEWRKYLPKPGEGGKGAE